jgi:hypothetical protein
MNILSRKTVLDGLSQVSFNLAAGWLGIVLFSPGFFGISLYQRPDLLIYNLPPAIIVFIVGLFLSERSKKR